MSSIFQKVAETPLRLRAEPVQLRLFGTAMAFVFAVELRKYSALEENSIEGSTRQQQALRMGTEIGEWRVHQRPSVALAIRGLVL